MIINVPLFVSIPRKTKPAKKYIINLNNYRNWCFIVNNQIKKAYKEMIYNDIFNLKFNNKISLEFILHRGNKRSSDRSNVLSIHEKFFCDALVDCGCIVDDRDEFIEETIYRTGNMDKENPRVEIIIKEQENVK